MSEIADVEKGERLMDEKLSIFEQNSFMSTYIKTDDILSDMRGH